MSVKVIDNTVQAVAQVRQRASLGVRLATQDLLRVSRPKTPFATGDLANRTLQQVLGLRGAVSWNVSYAWYQERGYTTGPIRKRPAGGQSHFAESSAKQVANQGHKYFK